jgi:hypothetical protein
MMGADSMAVEVALSLDLSYPTYNGKVSWLVESSATLKGVMI